VKLTKFIAINRPIIGDGEKKAVLEVLESGALTDSSFQGGRFVRDLEAKLASYVGVKHAVAVNSGTAALQVSLMAVGVHEGDEVIVPSFTFDATANVVLACGAKPVFADCQDDYTIDVGEIRRKLTKKTKAIIPVHVYGYPADLDEIRELAEPRGVRVIEDAAESLGAEYRGRQTGDTNDTGCFSFYATKVITSGEGGAVTTNDRALAEKVRMMRNHGMKEGYDSRVLGYNFRLPEISAAVASIQMDRLREFIAARQRNARQLTEEIGATKGVEVRQSKEDRTHIWYLYTLHVARNRDAVEEKLRGRGVGAVAYWKMPVNKTPLYAKLGYSTLKLPRTYEAAGHVLSLPVHPAVSREEVSYIAAQLKSVITSR
jgi:perosamine synthetase